MAISEFETKRIEKHVGAYVERRRPPPHIRQKVDISFRLTNQSVEIFEIRPDWQDPQIIREHPVGKATFVKKSKLWKVYWMRADQQWHRYDPTPSVNTIEDFLELLEADHNACFWG